MGIITETFLCSSFLGISSRNMLLLSEVEPALAIGQSRWSSGTYDACLVIKRSEVPFLLESGDIFHSTSNIH